MKTLIQKTIFILFILFVIIGCYSNSKQDYEKIFKENNKTFEYCKPKLNYIIADLKNNYIKNWKRQNELDINIESLSKQSQQNLKDLGIDGITVKTNPNDSCKNNYVISMNVNKGWNIETLKFVQIRYSPCDKLAEKNYHFYDGYHVDFWGQGDNWYIASDTDWL